MTEEGATKTNGASKAGKEERGRSLKQSISACARQNRSDDVQAGGIARIAELQQKVFLSQLEALKGASGELRAHVHAGGFKDATSNGDAAKDPDLAFLFSRRGVLRLPVPPPGDQQAEKMLTDVELCVASVVDGTGAVASPPHVGTLVQVMLNARNVESRALCLEVLWRSREREDCTRAFVALGGLRLLRHWLFDLHAAMLKAAAAAAARERDKDKAALLPQERPPQPGHLALLVLMLEVIRILPVDMASLRPSQLAKRVMASKGVTADPAVAALVKDIRARWKPVARATEPAAARAVEQLHARKLREAERESAAKRRETAAAAEPGEAAAAERAAERERQRQRREEEREAERRRVAAARTAGAAAAAAGAGTGAVTAAGGGGGGKAATAGGGNAAGGNASGKRALAAGDGASSPAGAASRPAKKNRVVRLDDAGLMAVGGRPAVSKAVAVAAAGGAAAPASVGARAAAEAAKGPTAEDFDGDGFFIGGDDDEFAGSEFLSDAADFMDDDLVVGTSGFVGDVSGGGGVTTAEAAAIAALSASAAAAAEVAPEPMAVEEANNSAGAAAGGGDGGGKHTTKSRRSIHWADDQGLPLRAFRIFTIEPKDDIPEEEDDGGFGGFGGGASRGGAGGSGGGGGGDGIGAGTAAAGHHHLSPAEWEERVKHERELERQVMKGRTHGAPHGAAGAAAAAASAATAAGHKTAAGKPTAPSAGGGAASAAAAAAAAEAEKRRRLLRWRVPAALDLRFLPADQRVVEVASEEVGLQQSRLRGRMEEVYLDARHIPPTPAEPPLAVIGAASGGDDDAGILIPFVNEEEEEREAAARAEAEAAAVAAAAAAAVERRLEEALGRLKPAHAVAFRQRLGREGGLVPAVTMPGGFIDEGLLAAYAQQALMMPAHLPLPIPLPPHLRHVAPPPQQVQQPPPGQQQMQPPPQQMMQQMAPQQMQQMPLPQMVYTNGQMVYATSQGMMTTTGMAPPPHQQQVAVVPGTASVYMPPLQQQLPQMAPAPPGYMAAPPQQQQQVPGGYVMQMPGAPPMQMQPGQPGQPGQPYQMPPAPYYYTTPQQQQPLQMAPSPGQYVMAPPHQQQPPPQQPPQPPRRPPERSPSPPGHRRYDDRYGDSDRGGGGGRYGDGRDRDEGRDQDRAGGGGRSDRDRGEHQERPMTAALAARRKTIPCEFFGKPGGCRRGDSCMFLHDAERCKALPQRPGRGFAGRGPSR